MWLRDFLPEDLKDVRVIVYGYDAKAARESKSKPALSKLATSMLDTMREVRDDQVSRL